MNSYVDRFFRDEEGEEGAEFLEYAVIIAISAILIAVIAVIFAVVKNKALDAGQAIDEADNESGAANWDAVDREDIDSRLENLK